MKNINEARYKNLSEAVAFVISFVPMIYSYDSVGWQDYNREVCSCCGKMEQYSDFLAPKSNCKKDHGILDSYHYALSVELKSELIKNFDICENDFRPVRNKTGDIVFYQITPQHIMKPISSVNRIKALKPCKKCGDFQHRIKEFKNKEGYIFYNITAEALEDLQDLNVSCERFEIYFPLFVVSRRVYEFLVSKNPRMCFEPMFLSKK